MLAFRLRDCYLDQLFVAPEYHGRGIGKMLLQFTRKQLPDGIWLRCASANEKAWRWYEREGFVFEKEDLHSHGLADALLSLEEGIVGMMKLYWSPRTRAVTAALDDGGDRPAI